MSKPRSGAAGDKFATYEAKRRFDVTPEPPPDSGKRRGEKPTFMVHKHDARRLHYDLRLEIDGALASWAVPKGPSFDPKVKRLAVQTEDHPLSYGGFEGRIPDGEYGAGDSLIWDRGTFEVVPPGTAEEQREKGHLTFELAGEKLKGRFHLVRTHGIRGSGNKASWLLFKADDEFADPAYDVVKERPESVESGITVTHGPARASALHAPPRGPEDLLRTVFPPMLATLVSAAPTPSEGWVFELKYDGYRALAAKSAGETAMWTRNGLDLEERFPHLAAAVAKLDVESAVLDGEIVTLDDKGVPRFSLLQQGHRKGAGLVVFDLLFHDGQDLRELPLEERRARLERVLERAPAGITLAERVAPEGALEGSAARGFEGVVVKERGSTYEGARSKAWLKVKAVKSQELAIVGFMPHAKNKGEVGALLVAYAQDGAFHFAGRVGTGFSAKQRASLLQALTKGAVVDPPVVDPPRIAGARWASPKLVAEVMFTEWTPEGKLRHPSFQGLRPDKTPLECTRERPTSPPHGAKAKAKVKAKATAAKATGEAKAVAMPRAKATVVTPAKKTEKVEVAITHPDRVLYPRDGITKQDVVDYYEAVSEPMLRALEGRPLALEHFWEGIDAAPLYRQNLGKTKPAWMTSIETPARSRAGTVSHVVADRPETLRWLAQQAALSIHMWLSRAPALEEPSFVLFDLDPAEGEGIAQAIPVALTLRRFFEELGLPSVPKTSGKRGLHVIVPLAPGHTFEQVISFAVDIGEGLAKLMPEVTLERSLAKRRGRLYLDCLQNAYGKTMVAPYSLRAVDGATVSAPLRWSEVSQRLDPAKYNLRSMPRRLDKVGDLFAPALAEGARLPTIR